MNPALIVAELSLLYGIVFMIFTVASISSQATSAKTFRACPRTFVPYWRPFLR